MKKHHLQYLSDPITKAPFQLVGYSVDNDRVIDGLLTTENSWYPVIKGVPRIMIEDLKIELLQNHHDFYNSYRQLMPKKVRAEWETAIAKIDDMDAFIKHQKRTAESFAYEWKYIYKENDYEEQNFFHFLSPFTVEQDLHGEITLDVGCGSGRFTKWAALSDTEISVGVDLGETVEVAYGMTKHLHNVCIVQADVYALPFKNIFDFVYSIGVLHHLPNPQKGFSMLSSITKQNGLVTIWVYNRRNNKRAIYFYEPLRAVLKRLPKPVLFKMSYIPAAIVHLLNQITLLLKEWNLPKAASVIPFSYYANFSFNMKLNDAFDVIATPKSNYYTFEEIERWFQDVNLRDVRTYEHPEAGITAIGTHV